MTDSIGMKSNFMKQKRSHQQCMACYEKQILQPSCCRLASKAVKRESTGALPVLRCVCRPLQYKPEGNAEQQTDGPP